MLIHTAFPRPIIHPLPFARKSLQVEFVPDFPPVPILPETLLRLDLEVQQSCVDLRKMSEAVLGDLGAAVQIWRMAGQEFGLGEGRPTRIEDCICGLGTQACMNAVSAQSIGRDDRYSVIVATWAHCREIAQHARLIAEETADQNGNRVNGDEAYLVGLFHALGLLPSILGWDTREPGVVDNSLVGFKLARRWSLPRCVMEFFGEMHLDGYPSHWSTIVRVAHHRADRSCIDCPFEEEMRPRLHLRGQR